jgi:hypothetical protein
MLEKLVKVVPSHFIYRVLDTPVGKYLYERGFTDTCSRTVTCPDITFEMRMPSNELYLWDDFTPDGCHEPLTTRAMLAPLAGRDAATVWDVGSKCGYFMMVAAQATLAERVHVFEPTSPHVQVIHENNDRYLDGGARINRTTVGDTEEDGRTTGDAYATRHGPPDLVKIDVDGPEVSVLRGLTETLGTHSPTLLVEVHVGDDWDRKRAQLGDLLDTHPYDFWVARNHRDADGEWQHIDTISELGATVATNHDFLLRCAVPEQEVDSAW